MGYVDGELGAHTVHVNSQGAFTLANPQNISNSRTSGSSYNGIAFSASHSNSIYDDNLSVVQPPALNALVAIRY